MKRVINGKVYDTEKSEMIYYDRQNRRKYYMTKNRAFFCYYEKVGKIELVSEDDMKELLGIYDYDKYVEIFGEPEEG